MLESDKEAKLSHRAQTWENKKYELDVMYEFLFTCDRHQLVDNPSIEQNLHKIWYWLLFQQGHDWLSTQNV